MWSVETLWRSMGYELLIVNMGQRKSERVMKERHKTAENKKKYKKIQWYMGTADNVKMHKQP